MKKYLMPCGWVLATVLLAVGLCGNYGPAIEGVPGISWVMSAKAGKVTKAWIVEESAKRPKLPHAQSTAISAASTLGIAAIDQNITDRDGKTPEELLPILKAAAGNRLPQLVRQWSTGRITSIDCPPDLESLKSAAGGK